MSSTPEPADAVATGMSRALEDMIPVRLHLAADRIAVLARVLFEERFGLRFTDLRILTFVHVDEQQTMIEISRRARIDKAWVSRLVRELADKGLVERRPDPADARALLVSLTPRGRKLQADVHALTTLVEKDLIAGIDAAAFVAMLDRFTLNVDAVIDGEARLSAAAADERVP